MVVKTVLSLLFIYLFLFFDSCHLVINSCSHLLIAVDMRAVQEGFEAVSESH